ncbi:MAG: HigA family addiction module antidote protein [Candidatus Peribacteria bacterium]|jgi:addiction module HigA family antidote|nr:HigA family addiction module antidote protein [Candidatus Peribacteria bacterium]
MTEMIIHPGEFIADELKARGRTQKKFAKIIQKSPAEVNHIITGKRHINADRAIRLSLVFGTSAEIWMKFQTKYDLQMVERSKQEQNVFSVIKKTVSQYNELAVA